MKKKEQCIIVWFRHNLRLEDNQAFFEALSFQFPVIPLFIFDSRCYDKKDSIFKKWWLHQNLVSLQQDLNAKELPLVIQKGKTETVIKKCISHFDMQAVVSHYTVEPQFLTVEKKVAAVLKKEDIPLTLYHDSTLFDPKTIVSKSGTPYLKFAAFKRAIVPKLKEVKRVSIKSRSLKKVKTTINSISIQKLQLLSPKEDYSTVQSLWAAGQKGAQKRLSVFIKNNLKSYHKTRNIPALENGTSRLSPYLTLGVISPSFIVKKIYEAITKDKSKKTGGESFLSELVWREFAHYLLYHFPHLAKKSYKAEFDTFAWEKKKNNWQNFLSAKTGYPLVDAGIRQLYQTGWMHNRVRMNVASFLTKDLFISWQTGERWMFSYLIDADTASNVFNWQWVFGSGVDAAPYFRIFNPMLQAKTYDKDKLYVKRYIPEQEKHYPEPIFDHDTQRKQALQKFKKLKKFKKS